MGTTIKGTLTGAGKDSIRVLVSNGATSATSSIARSSIRWIVTPQGKRRNGKNGMFLGFLGGAVVGTVVGAATHEECKSTGLLACGPLPTSTEEAALAGALGGGIGGLFIGGIIGRFVRTERWVPAQISVQTGSRDRAVGARVSIPVP